MAWQHISSNFNNLNALRLMQFRNDSGISMGEHDTADLVSKGSDGLLVPKQEPHDYSTTHCLRRPRDILPNFEEHDTGGYNFKLSIRPQCGNGSQWLYSEMLNKLFIRLNKLLNIDITYVPKSAGEQLRVRSFICFLKEVSEPVRRCANHISKDFEIRPHIERENVMRCENPSAIYCGNSEGKNIRDRFSIVLPLHTDTRSEGETLRQTLAFRFTCQNSCIGRKQTCLMILLEDMNGVVLGQRWLYLRICSCPKRDKSYEERHALLRCIDRGSDAEETYNQRISTVAGNTKTEIKQYEVQPTASGGVRVIFEVSNKDIALSTIQYAYAKECVNIVTQSKDSKRSVRNLRKLKRLCDEGSKL